MTKAAKLNEIAAEQNDKLFKSFNELSKSGLIASGGMNTVFENLQTMKMTTAELENFNRLLIGNSKELKLFGTTAGEGATEFAKVAGGLYDEFNQTLGLLGVTADDQREHTLRYIAQQTRLGMIQGKTQEQLIKGTKNYIEELDRIAMLTGASRQEQEDARKAILEMQSLRGAIRQAELDRDEPRKRALETAQAVSATLQAMGLTRGAAGVAQFVSGRGVVGEESAAAFATFGPKALDAIMAGKSAADVLQLMNQSTKQITDQLAQPVSIGADLNALLTDSYARLDDFVISITQAQKAIKPGETLDEAALRLQREKREKADPRTLANVKATENMQRTAINLDTAVNSFTTATKIYELSSAGMLEASKLLKQFTTGGSSSSTTPTSPGPKGSLAAPTSGLSFSPWAGRMGNIPGALSSDIKLKSGAEKHGRSTDALYSAVNQVHAALGGDYKYFSGLNDRAPSLDNPSKHASGQAFDLVLNDPTQYASVLAKIKTINGISFANFEPKGKVNANGSVSTGDHIHAEVSAKYGGIASGPTTGFPATLHGPKEAIVPLATDSLLEKMATASASEFTQSMSNNGKEQTNVLLRLVDKVDEMISKLSTSNDIQDQILKYSRI